MRPSVLRPGLSVLVSLVIFGVLGTTLRGDAPLIAAPLIVVEDAFVEASADGWTIGNALIRYSLGRIGGGAIGARGIEDPLSGRDWSSGSAPDTVLRVNGQVIGVGSAQTLFVGAEVSDWSGGVRLDLAYRIGRLDLRRSYVCYPASSIIETWTTLHQQENGESATVAELTNFSLGIQNGTMNWISGLQQGAGSSAPFNRLSGDLDDGQIFDLGSDRRASELSLPWFSVHAGDQDFFGSILWSGSWRLHTERRGEKLTVQLGLPGFETTVGAGASLETPHAIFGITNRIATDTSIALRNFIERGVRRGRPLNAPVTYNTWYSRGTFLDEASMLVEMDVAAAIGVEVFVIDAGWWRGANQNDSGDFVTNWGNWLVDEDRFPNGLGYLSDRAHELGLKFGVWVEPERVDPVTVGQPGLAKERFLASDQGAYVPPAVDPAGTFISGRRRARPRVPTPADPSIPDGRSLSAQICLVDSEARAWLVDKVAAFIEETRADYLKWDNNLWVNCSRPGHGHGAADANFLHHRSLQTVLDELRERFPNLEIENCAAGGNRLSLDMLSRTDAAWMDDHTEPAARVRHEVQGLLSLLPPPYLLSFATTSQEQFDDAHISETSYVLRSRMLGMPGFSWQLSTMDEDLISGVAREIALYKRLRPYQQMGSALLLSGPVQPPGSGSWDAVEFLLAGGSDAAVLAYNAPDAPEPALLRLRGLRPDAIYAVESGDAGLIGTATGQDLMDRGVELWTASLALGHVIFLHAE